MTHLRALPAVGPGEDLATVMRRSTRAHTFAELASLSSARKARTAIARGEVVRLLPDAYVSAAHQDSFAARADAALLWAGPTAMLSGPAAMYLWGFLDEPPSTIDLLLPHPMHHQTPPWLRVRRVTWSPPLSRVNGMTVVGPAHAVVLGYGFLAARDRATAVHQAIRTRLVTPRSLIDTLGKVPRVRARRDLRQRLELALAGAESYLEEHGASKVFNTSEFARFVRQHRVRANGGRYRLDMFDPETLTAVELDGDASHSDPSQRQRDLRRDADLAQLGIQTIRISYRDLTTRPEWCRALVRGVLVARSAR
ncbi:hypothetical protein QQX09_08275 [Demequina sp. SYSU T00192]|uniref:DUF559 domain-containing protein n=1 Tax=Demequina litoralis TaxID=3051660 RepID=A0ABT8GA29_9MICO|nr:hypothetical protein [Demequina sp. SYSU T00192]MDN4475852.1 hypothetical protein [Demequina sp. SYSU T00192]